MGAPLGNKNAANGRIWEEALKRALARSAGTLPQGLDTIADKVVLLAVGGSMFAIQEIANRLDGKPAERRDLDHGDHRDIDTAELDRRIAALERETSAYRGIEVSRELN